MAYEAEQAATKNQIALAKKARELMAAKQAAAIVPAPVFSKSGPAPKTAPKKLPALPSVSPPPDKPSGFQTVLSPTDPAAIGGAATAKPTAPPAPSIPPSPVTTPSAQAVKAPAPVPTPEQDLMAQRNAVLSSMVISPEEQQLKKQIEELQSRQATLGASEAMGLQNVAGQPIAMPFISGQQSALQGQTAAIQQSLASQAQPLMAQLAAAQAARQAATERAQLQLGYTQGDIDTQRAAVSAEKAAKDKAAEPVTLSSGSQLIDRTTGRVIAAAPKEETYSGTVGEYKFYAEQEQKAGRSPMTFDAYQTMDANRKVKIAAAGVLPADNPLVKTVLDNPELFNQLTATEKARIAPALNAMGYTSFGKPYSDTAIKEITQTESAVDMLDDLKTKIMANLQYIGPIYGLQALNPYSKARQVQADIDRVKQVVGKTLEGGVLRKEDEEKYKKILATMTDTPETAISKVDNLISQLKSNLQTYKNAQALAGRGSKVQTLGDGSQWQQNSDGSFTRLK